MPAPAPTALRPTEKRPTPRLTVSVTLGSGTIILAGDLNRRTVRHLLDAARTLGLVPQASWTVDVRALTSYDESGLRGLGACYRQAVRQGIQMSVVGAGDPLRTALGRVRLDRHVFCAGHQTVDTSLPGRTYPLVRVPA